MVTLAGHSTDDAEAPATSSIVVEKVSASYRVRVDSTTAAEDVRRLLRRGSSPHRLIPALRDVSFTVPKGAVLAVIGRNGAGKSTLCRVISGALPPERGRVVVRGRMNLLTPGIGFSDVLTGRENITMGGLASGLTPERVEALSEEIAGFAQLEGYLDLPLRSYSTGMRMRLASSIAVFLDPEVLIIDEALTGGDAAFGRHIAERTAQLVGQGRTIVLVTHGISTARTMATLGLWLHQGRVAAFGDPDDVIGAYLRYCRLEDRWSDDL